MKEARIKEKVYSAQALAIVLIVLVVAAIIALAIISRVKSEQRNVADERSSSQSLSVSENLLDAITVLPISEVAELVNDTENNNLYNLCKTEDDLEYEFWENGCVLNNTSEVAEFLNALDEVHVGSDNVYSVIAEQMEAELVASCGNDQHEVEMTILPIEEGEELVLQEGIVLSLIPDSDPIDGCSVTVNSNRVRDSVKTGILESSHYFSETAGFAEYDYDLSNGYCLFDCSADLAWVGANPTSYNNGWINSPDGASFTKAMKITQGANEYIMSELRLRPLGDDVIISYVTSPTGCVDLKEIMKLRVVTSCSGTTQGKETIIPRENWTPSVFDYTIYNGQGEFEYELY